MLKLNKKWLSAFVVISMFGLQGCSKDSEGITDTNTPSNTTKLEESASNNTNSAVVEETNVSDVNNVGEAELHFIDTGNSDAILIKQGGKFALIDGGDNDDEKTIVNYLKKQEVNELEYVFATHPHADHIGGLDAVIDNIKVNNVYVSNGDADTKTYRDFINSMANKGLYPSVPLLNSEFKLGASTFKVVSVANTNDTNNNSIVLLYTNGNDSVLLMGDAEKDIEAKLNIGKVDLLKVGHHGSHSSSTPSFIDNVSPKYAVIQVGEGNKYGHPHTETMDTLKSRGIIVHRNDECGNIVFKSSGKGLTVDCKEGSYKSPNGKGGGSYSNISNVIKPVEEPKVENNTDNSSANIVYWTNGATKYHLDPNCSNMKNPQSGTIEESGREACKKCA